MEGSSILFKNNTFEVNDNMTCKAKNIIYVIQCGGCNEQYVGETVNFRSKVTLHNQHIRVPELRKIPVSGHIADCCDREPEYFIFPFYQMKTETYKNCVQTERKLIKSVTLSTLTTEHYYIAVNLCLNKALKID